MNLLTHFSKKKKKKKLNISQIFLGGKNHIDDAEVPKIHALNIIYFVFIMYLNKEIHECHIISDLFICSFAIAGSDSPTTHTKDVTTHTRAIKIKHQELQEKLEMCIHELRKLCIREAVSNAYSTGHPQINRLKPGEAAYHNETCHRTNESHLIHLFIKVLMV